MPRAVRTCRWCDVTIVYDRDRGWRELDAIPPLGQTCTKSESLSRPFHAPPAKNIVRPHRARH